TIGTSCQPCFWRHHGLGVNSAYIGGRLRLYYYTHPPLMGTSRLFWGIGYY
ncbi:hypothetical protein L9F63_026178, partial [Diploptera punctata]